MIKCHAFWGASNIKKEDAVSIEYMMRLSRKTSCFWRPFGQLYIGEQYPRDARR